MSLQGNLRDFSVSDILQLLATQRKSGCLVVERERRVHCVYVLDGRIVSTRGSTAPGQDPLLRFVVRIRCLSEEQLRGITTLLGESGRDLEDLLVNGRYLDAETLAGLLERQILEDLVDLAEWKEGTYTFDSDRRWPHPVWIRLNIEASLIEAARRVDERQRFAELFRDPTCVPTVVDLPGPDEPLSAEESEMFSILDGRRTVPETVAAAALSDYEAHEALQRMVEAGWVRLADGPVAGAAGPAEAAPLPALGEPPAPRRTTGWARDVAVAAAIVAALATLWLAARAVPPPRARGEGTAFAAARVRDVRYVLELYHREHGEYPGRLEDLVAGGWLEPRQLVIEGRRLGYRLVAERGDYELTLPR